jgi:RNA polymerase sigma-70 factor (ECF subfamily)
MSDGIAFTALTRSTDGAFARHLLPAGSYSAGAVAAPSSRVMNTDAVHPDMVRLGNLMERYADGDDSVFDQLYELMAPKLFRFCLRLTMRAAEAEDCFQETFLKLHRARGTYAGGSSALNWAFAIARSVYLTRLRYWRRHPEQLGFHDDVAKHDADRRTDRISPEDQIAAVHMLDVVSIELSRMSEKNRTAYVLLKEENLSTKEAAALLGTSTDVVKQRAHRACEQLRAALHSAGWREHGTHAR